MNVTIKHRLDFWACFFLNSGTHKYISAIPQTKLENDTSPTIYIETHNYYCKSHGKYLANTPEAGHFLTLLLCVLTFVIGLLGILTNTGTIFIFRKTVTGKTSASYMEGLALLAIVDLILCGATVGFSFFTILILENFSRSLLTIHLFRTSILIYTITRTMSVYATILITIERYIVVAYPLHSKAWLKCRPWKCRLVLLAILIFSILVKMPWTCQSTIKPMEHTDLQSLQLFPYLIKRNAFGRDFNRGLQEALLILDVFVPFPILITFNALICKTIHDWTQTRKMLTASRYEKREINVTKMFSVVVLVLLCNHSVFCIVYFTGRYQKVIYRELLLLQSLSVVFGVAVNFLVYYNFGSSFREELWKCMRSIFDTRYDWVNKHYEKHCGDKMRKSDDI